MTQASRSYLDSIPHQIALNTRAANCASAHIQRPESCLLRRPAETRQPWNHVAQHERRKTKAAIAVALMDRFFSTDSDRSDLQCASKPKPPERSQERSDFAHSRMGAST